MSSHANGSEVMTAAGAKRPGAEHAQGGTITGTTDSDWGITKGRITRKWESKEGQCNAAGVW